MDIASILLILALLLPVALFVARPLFARASIGVSESARRTSALLAEREGVLAALQELDFDHVVGKIPEEEYPARRTALVAEGVTILKQLDEVERETSNFQLPTPKRQTSNGHVEDVLEAAVAKARRSDPDLDATLEAAVASARATTSRLPENGKPGVSRAAILAATISEGGFCPNCGKPVKAGDKFCANCGRTLVPAQERA